MAELQHKHTNRLIHESSPYLLQHAHNPVEWHPWGEEAFEKARTEDKLMIVSIGYSSCHWCHVMEHESFEDEEVAKLMNEHFVCIKVDREERPDVDQYYMDAANIMQGRGGWPLNAIALPDKRPVYAATYFPKERWVGLLENLYNGYKHQRQQYLDYAEKLSAGIAGLSLFEVPKEKSDFTEEQLKSAIQVYKHNFDQRNGGNGRAPKFPMPDIYLFLLRYYHLTKDNDVLQHVLFTLDKMGKGGIYDQLGGGFARYSVDAKWHVPHFEKMLYDNAQLISLYSEAYQLTKDEFYMTIVYETIGWAERELLSPEGGFYSALDADSEGAEGKFYMWKEQEFDELLGDDARVLKEHFGIGGEAYWEHGDNVLVLATKAEEIAATNDISIEEVKKTIASGKAKLMDARDKRIRPGLDDKILFSWNALMLKGLIDVYNSFRDERFLALAGNLHEFLESKMTKGLQLYRTFKNNKATIPAFLEDYSIYIQALLAFYQLTFDEKHLKRAEALTAHVFKHFHANDKGYFYFTAEDNKELSARKIDVSDNVIASPNSIMASNLFTLGKLTDNEEYLKKTNLMLAGVMEQFTQYGPWYSKWGILLLHHLYPFYEVAIVGEEAVEARNKIEQLGFTPNKVLIGSLSKSDLPLLQHKGDGGKTIIYVCENKICSKPTDKVEEAIELLKHS